MKAKTKKPTMLVVPVVFHDNKTGLQSYCMMGAAMPPGKKIILNKARALESAEEIKEYFKADSIMKFGESLCDWLLEQTKQPGAPQVELIHQYYHESTSFSLESYRSESIGNSVTRRCLSPEEHADFLLYFRKASENKKH